MAVAVKSDQVTNIDAGVKLNPNEHNKLNRVYASYTTDGTEVLYSTIEMARLPVGAILDPISHIHCEALGSNTALSIGNGDDAAYYAASTATTSECDIYLSLVDAQGEAIGDYKSVFLTVSGTGTLDAACDIHGWFYFVY